MNEQTFIDSCLAGTATPDQIDVWIERWHAGEIGRTVELREIIGMTCREYAAWLKDTSVEEIVAERKQAKRV